MKYACKCGSSRIKVSVLVWADLYQSDDQNVETHAGGDHEWDGSSPAICRACGKAGIMDDFELKPWTVFCRPPGEAEGTTWIDTVWAHTAEKAAEMGQNQCMGEWEGCEAMCVGVIEGDHKVALWDDNGVMQP